MKKKLIMLLAIVFLLSFMISGGILIRNWWIKYSANQTYEELAYSTNDFEVEKNTEPEGTDSKSGIEIPNKNIDWMFLKETNEDIYAWIYIPNTNVDYPVLQHPSDDAYYLKHNLDGSSGYPGCIYSEKTYTATDFSDFNTVLYGHRMNNGTMFNHLHKFSDNEFFNENPYIYIYTPEKVLVYKIFAAYTFSDSHLNLTYDTTTESGVMSYINVIDGLSDGNFREDVSLGKNDHIITLSTCTRQSEKQRFLLQGVLINPDLESIE